jgi:hypothetical protein
VQRDLGLPQRSLATLDKVFSQLSDVLDDDERGDLWCWAKTSYINAWLDAGRTSAESVAWAESVLLQREQRWGASHAYTARSLHTLSRANLFDSNLRDAIRYARSAVSLRRHLLGDSHPHTARSYLLLAKCEIALGRLGDAQQSLALAEAGQASLPAMHPDKARGMWIQSVLTQSMSERATLIHAAQDIVREATRSHRAVALYEWIDPRSPTFHSHPVV